MLDTNLLKQAEQALSRVNKQLRQNKASKTKQVKINSTGNAELDNMLMQAQLLLNNTKQPKTRQRVQDDEARRRRFEKHLQQIEQDRHDTRYFRRNVRNAEVLIANMVNTSWNNIQQVLNDLDLHGVEVRCTITSEGTRVVIGEAAQYTMNKQNKREVKKHRHGIQYNIGGTTYNGMTGVREAFGLTEHKHMDTDEVREMIEMMQSCI